MNIEQDPCPPSSADKGRRAHYEKLKASEETYRANQIAGMSWLRPFDRISRMRSVSNSNRVIGIADRNIERGRLEEAHVIIGETVVQAEVQVEPIVLTHNPATQHPIAAV